MSRIRWDWHRKSSVLVGYQLLRQSTVLHPIMRLASFKELFSSHLLFSLFLLIVSDVLWSLFENRETMRILHLINLKPELEVLHSRLYFFLLSKDWFLGILVLVNYRPSFNKASNWWQTHFSLCQLPFPFLTVGNAGGSDETFSLSDFGLRRNFSFVQCHGCCQLEWCLVFHWHSHVSVLLLRFLSRLSIEKVSRCRLERFLTLTNVLENRIVLVFLPVRNLLTEIMCLLIDLLGVKRNFWHLLRFSELLINTSFGSFAFAFSSCFLIFSLKIC